MWEPTLPSSKNIADYKVHLHAEKTPILFFEISSLNQ